MGWVKKGGAAPVYVRTVRVEGRRVTEYYGRGALARWAEERDEKARQERQAAQEARKAERLALATIERLTRDHELASRLATDAALLAAGYHRHDRGEWRRRRGQ